MPVLGTATTAPPGNIHQKIVSSDFFRINTPFPGRNKEVTQITEKKNFERSHRVTNSTTTSKKILQFLESWTNKEQV